MTSVFFCKEIMDFINGTTGIQPPTNSSTTSTPFTHVVYTLHDTPPVYITVGYLYTRVQEVHWL